MPQVLEDGETCAPLVYFQETIFQPAGKADFEVETDCEVILVVLQGTLSILEDSALLKEATTGTACRIGPNPFVHRVLDNASSHDLAVVLEITMHQQARAQPSDELTSIVLPDKPVSLVSVASGQGHEGSLSLKTDCAVYLGNLRPGEHLIFETLISRRVFLFVQNGAVRAEEHRFLNGDSALIMNEATIPLAAQQRSRFVLIDLPEFEKDPL
jgi:redox-sensitive bicupin YhaK (pirin superfamily)